MSKHSNHHSGNKSKQKKQNANKQKQLFKNILIIQSKSSQSAKKQTPSNKKTSSKNSKKLVAHKQQTSDPATQDISVPSHPKRKVEPILHPTPFSTATYPPDKIKYAQESKEFDLFRFPIINWHYRWQRPQQICRQFAFHGHRVFYFSPETIIIGDPNAILADIQSKLQFKEVDPHIWEVKLCSYSSLNVYQDVIQHPLDQQFMGWSIEVLKQIFHIQHTVSIIDLSFWSPLVFSLKDNKTIYDCMDEHAGFADTPPKLLTLEPNLMIKSDAVVASSKPIYHEVKRYNCSAHLIRNAGEYEHFAMGDAKKAAMDLPEVKGPIIGYVGAIADWFDMKLVHELATRNPDWNFMLIGNTHISSIEEISKCNNVFLLGEKSYDELPSYIQSFDVCIIPFLINNLTLATNPVKVYEYLAAGKPVVSSDLPELRTMQEYVWLASGTQQFECSIHAALLKTDQEKHIDKRRLFAAKHTWKKRYESFKAIISKNLYPKVSIVILTHNNWKLSQQCVDSLLKNTNYPLCEFIIIDNASTDGTVSWLNTLTHPQVRTILLSENSGCTAGNTIGMMNAKGDYLILLNNDTVVPDGWLSRLLRPFSIGEGVGAVGPVSNHVGNDQILDMYVGDGSHAPDPVWLNEFYQLYKHGLRYTELLGFYCIAIKREVIEKVGYLDAEFGNGMFEDNDYCLRIRKSGYKLAIAEDAFVYHHGGATFKHWADEKYHALFHKNKTYFETKWGITWRQLKMPANMFIQANDSQEIANLSAMSGQRTVLLYCPDAWNYPYSAWQQQVLEMSRERRKLIIALVKFYHGIPIYGIRKIGLNLYFTSNEQLLGCTRFDETHVFLNCEEKSEAIEAIEAIKPKPLDLVAVKMENMIP